MTLWQDLRYAVRSLKKSPGLVVFAVLALALGVGANAAIFSIVDAVLLRPLQFRDQAQLVEVWEDLTVLGFPHNTPSPGNFIEWRRRNHVFTEMAALKGDLYAITGDGPPEQVEGNPVTANLFSMLGVSPLLGRPFTAADDQPGGPKVVLLSYGLWQRRFGADPQIAGKQIRLNGEAHQILGVMPLGFQFPERADLWVPLALSAQEQMRRGVHYLKVYARLKLGVSLETAQRDMKAIAAQMAQEYPETNAKVAVEVGSLREQLVGNLRLGLLVLAGGVGCVLLITCANVASLLLARAAGQGREMAVRAALGADRFRLVQQSLVESLVVALSGGICGVLLAVWSLPFLRQLVPLALTGWSQPHVDGRLLLFTLLVSVAAAILFGSLPAAALSRVDLVSALQQGGRGGIGGRQTVRQLLVIGEVALVVTLTVGAGLLAQTWWQLSHVDLGFVPAGVLTLRTNLPQSPESPYRSFRARAHFYQEVLARVQVIPGVAAAGYTTFLPLTNAGGTSGFTPENEPVPDIGADANHRVVSSEYLQTIGVRLQAGRFFSRTDGPDNLPVAIVNEAMARQYWPGKNPLGRRFYLGQSGPWITIVGVVDNVRQMGLDVAGRAEMYFPCTQPAASFGFYTPRDLAVRVHGDPLSYSSAVRAAIWEVDRNQPVADVMPMTQLIADKLAVRDTQLKILGALAGLALLLAALGLYGLLAYTVAQRTREIGVRLALGASRSQVLGAVMSEGMKLVLAGLAAGGLGAAALTRVMSGLLYGVSATDPLTFGATALLLLAVGLMACYVPARRAAATDPMVALRYE